MKQWEIDEFLKECEELCWNQYTYDYSRMPKGICNGHSVEPYMESWHSIVIDDCIHSMAAYSEKFPSGNVEYISGGVTRTALEDVRRLLMKEPSGRRMLWK